MAEALRSTTAEEAGLIRCHGLAQGRRQCPALAHDFPAESAVVVAALKLGYDHEDEARDKPLSAQERWAYHQPYRAPVFTTLKPWREQQTAQPLVDPKSSLGKAIAYLLEHWDTLTQIVQGPGAPLDNNGAERALKLWIRPRTTSRFSATEHSAYVARILTRVIAPCVQAGVKALDYLVALHEQRPAVFANPRAWLPWHYPAALVPS
jgi:transposase